MSFAIGQSHSLYRVISTDSNHSNNSVVHPAAGTVPAPPGPPDGGHALPQGRHVHRPLQAIHGGQHTRRYDHAT